MNIMPLALCPVFCLGLVLGHLFSEQPQTSETTEMAFSEHIAKISVPSKSAGALIGPGGINVKVCLECPGGSS